MKTKIIDDIINRIKDKISKYDYNKNSGNPFIDELFGKYSRQKSLIHGMATSFGSYYETMAVMIAEDNPRFTVAKKYKLSGSISPSESAVITNIAKDLEEKVRIANHDSEVALIYAEDSTERKDTSITIDLYLVDVDGKEYFIEMKGPDPNKKEVRAAKEDLLNVIAIKKERVDVKDFSKKVAVVFGVYYNNKSGVYDNWKVSGMFEKGVDFLVQESFWELLGGRGTWRDILEIIEEVRKEIYPHIEKTMETRF